MQLQIGIKCVIISNWKDGLLSNLKRCFFISKIFANNLLTGPGYLRFIQLLLLLLLGSRGLGQLQHVVNGRHRIYQFVRLNLTKAVRLLDLTQNCIFWRISFSHGVYVHLVRLITQYSHTRRLVLGWGLRRKSIQGILSYFNVLLIRQRLLVRILCPIECI